MEAASSKQPSSYERDGERDIERGVGGKLRKPFTRKAPFKTPYSRPPNQSRSSTWISRLVGGATKILPSFFSRSVSTDTVDIDIEREWKLLLRVIYTEEERKRERGAGGKLRKPFTRKTPSTTPYSRPSNQSRSATWISRLVGGATKILPSLFSRSTSTSSDEYNDPEEEENPNEENKVCSSNLGEAVSTEETNQRVGKEILNASSEGNEFSKIEQLVKEREFSRDDVNRLLELLHSNVVESSNVEPVEKDPKNPIQREEEGYALSHETPRLLFKEKPESLLGTPMTLFKSNIEEEVGASPRDIARAYMNRVSEPSTDYKGTLTKNIGDLVRSDRYSSKSLISSPLTKTSPCWPGAMAEDRFANSTPQTQSVSSSRYGLHQFQRSPYARTINSKSKSKLARPEAESKRFQNFPSSTRVQPQTPIFGQAERIHNEINGSAGPIRHMRRKFLSESSPRSSLSSLSPQNGHLPAVFTNNFLPTTKNLDPTASKATTENGSEAGVPAFQTSNPSVRAILEHLDRHKPTPKEREAELQLATSSIKSSLSRLTDTVPNEGNDLAKSYFKEKRPQERSEAADVDKGTKTSTTANGHYDCDRKSFNEAFSFGLPNIRVKNTDKQSTSHNEKEKLSFTNMPLNSIIPESLKRPPHHPSGPKPNLASISVDKPYVGQTFFSNANSSGFTFPVSSRSGALPEPPTPSIMPSSTSGSPPQPKNNANEVPKFKFGEKKRTPGLKFSFPSTSNALAQDEVSDIKFSFGAGKKNRLSFKSIGEVASC